MKLKPGFELMKVAGDYLAIPSGGSMDPFDGAAILNEVSAFLLNALKTDVSEAELLEKVLAEYAIDRATAAKDLREALDTFAQLGWIER